MFVRNCGSGFKVFRNIQTRELDIEGLPPLSAIKWIGRRIRPCIMNITSTFTTDVIVIPSPSLFHQNFSSPSPNFSSPSLYLLTIYLLWSTGVSIRRPSKTQFMQNVFFKSINIMAATYLSNASKRLCWWVAFATSVITNFFIWIYCEVMYESCAKQDNIGSFQVPYIRRLTQDSSIKVLKGSWISFFLNYPKFIFLYFFWTF